MTFDPRPEAMILMTFLRIIDEGRGTFKSLQSGMIG